MEHLLQKPNLGQKKNIKFQPANMKERRKKRAAKGQRALKEALFHIHLSLNLAWRTSWGVGVP